MKNPILATATLLLALLLPAAAVAQSGSTVRLPVGLMGRPDLDRLRSSPFPAPVGVRPFGPWTEIRLGDGRVVVAPGEGLFVSSAATLAALDRIHAAAPEELVDPAGSIRSQFIYSLIEEIDFRGIDLDRLSWDVEWIISVHLAHEILIEFDALFEGDLLASQSYIMDYVQVYHATGADGSWASWYGTCNGREGEYVQNIDGTTYFIDKETGEVTQLSGNKDEEEGGTSGGSGENGDGERRWWQFWKKKNGCVWKPMPLILAFLLDPFFLDLVGLYSSGAISLADLAAAACDQLARDLIEMSLVTLR